MSLSASSSANTQANSRMATPLILPIICRIKNQSKLPVLGPARGAKCRSKALLDPNLSLGEQHFGGCGADDELSDDLGPILESSQGRALIQFFRHNNGVTRHQPGFTEAAQEKAIVAATA